MTLSVTDPGFGQQPMTALLPALRRELEQRSAAEFSVPDPDLGAGLYAGEAGPAGRHRPWAVWTDLADVLDAHLLVLGREGDRVRLSLRRRSGALDTAQDYSVYSEFARIDKLEDPVLLLTLVEALRRIALPERGRVLALGVGRGRELDALPLAYPGRTFEVVGVDRDASALSVAARRWPDLRPVGADISALPPDLGQFDGVLALSVLQSRGVDLGGVLRTLRRHHLRPAGGLVLGFPNARYRGGELSYGARLRNFERPDLSLVMADVAQARRHLHKHGFKVFVTGKHEILVTAIPASANTPADLLL